MRMFGQNIAFLSGILCCCGGSFVLFIAGWTTLKVLIWKQRQAAFERQRRQPRYDADGSQLPPFVRGACTGCGHVFEQVAELPDGTRYCAHCYRKFKSGEPVDTDEG